MKVFKGVLIAIVGLFVLFLIVTVFLPSEYQIERKIEILAPPPIPYYLIYELRNWRYWDTWWNLDTNQIRTYSGQILGLNSKFSWSSINKDIGKGFVQIVEAKPIEYIKLILGFGYEFQSINQFRFMQLSNKILLTWRMHAELKFLGKWFRFFLDDVIGKDLENNLKNIKELSENIVKNQFAFFRDTIPETKILFISDSINISSPNLLQKFNSSYSELLEFSNQNRFNNSTFAILSMKSYDKNKFHFDVCLSVDSTENLQTNSRINIRTISKQYALRSIYFGPLDGIGKIINILNYVSTQNNIKDIKGSPIIIYYTGFPLKNDNENLAIIYIPL